MKKRLIGCLISFVAIFLFYCNPGIKVLEKVDNISSEIKKEFCPDSRLAYFNLSDSLYGHKLVLSGETSNCEARDSLLARLSRRLPDLEIINQTVCLPHPDLGDSVYGVINCSVAAQHRNADFASEHINDALLGETVRVLRTDARHGSKTIDFWYFVQMEDGYLGWILKQNLVRMTSAQLNAWRAKPKMVVTSNFSQAYCQPDQKSQSVSDLVVNNVIARIAVKGSWVKIGFPDGREGFVRKNDVADLKSPDQFVPTPNSIIETTNRFIGFPYVWGGASAKGFDCSGLSRTVYRINGIELPRDANMQVRFGTPVELDDDFSKLKPGDLIFFGKSAQNPTHVGIYAGNKEFIHSSGSGLVIHDSFDSKSANYNKYRPGTPVAVRRILP